MRNKSKVSTRLEAARDRAPTCSRPRGFIRGYAAVDQLERAQGARDRLKYSNGAPVIEISRVSKAGRGGLGLRDVAPAA